MFSPAFFFHFMNGPRLPLHLCLLCAPTGALRVPQVPQGKGNELKCEFHAFLEGTMYTIYTEKRPERAETPLERQKGIICGFFHVCTITLSMPRVHHKYYKRRRKIILLAWHTPGCTLRLPKIHTPGAHYIVILCDDESCLVMQARVDSVGVSTFVLHAQGGVLYLCICFSSMAVMLMVASFSLFAGRQNSPGDRSSR